MASKRKAKQLIKSLKRNFLKTQIKGMMDSIKSDRELIRIIKQRKKNIIQIAGTGIFKVLNVNEKTLLRGIQKTKERIKGKQMKLKRLR